jgi:hypothetical protein
MVPMFSFSRRRSVVTGAPSVDGQLPDVQRRIRLAGVLVSVGLLAQSLTLSRVHPLAFMAFILIAYPLLLVGVLLYLYSIVSYKA